METNPFENLGPGFFWVHANGPDGLYVLLIRWEQWGDHAVLLDDGDRVVVPEKGDDGLWSLHKWTVLHVEPVERPAPFGTELE